MQAIPDGKQATTLPSVLSRTAIATFLIMAAIVALAITSLVQNNERATAQSPDPIQAARLTLTVLPSVPPDSGEASQFALGHVEFDRAAAAPGGIPGFDAWPPGGRP
jgi:hypothetical protein